MKQRKRQFISEVEFCFFSGDVGLWNVRAWLRGETIWQNFSFLLFSGLRAGGLGAHIQTRNSSKCFQVSDLLSFKILCQGITRRFLGIWNNMQKSSSFLSSLNFANVESKFGDCYQNRSFVYSLFLFISFFPLYFFHFLSLSLNSLASRYACPGWSQELDIFSDFQF